MLESSHFLIMESSSPKLITPFGILVDLVLTGVFAYFMSDVVGSHVPLDPVDYPLAFSIITYATTACLSGVFWLALGCFRVTFKDQLLSRKEACSKKASCCQH